MYIYIYESVKNTQAVTTDQAGETDADACSSTDSRDMMEVLPEAHGRSSKQREPPENLQKKKAMENGRRRSVRFRSDITSSSQTRDPSLTTSPSLL